MVDITKIISAEYTRGDTLSWIIQQNVWNVEKNVICLDLHAADKYSFLRIHD